MKRIDSVRHWRKQATACIVLLFLLVLCGCTKTEVPDSVSITANDSVSAITEDVASAESVESTVSRADVPAEQGSQQVPATEDFTVKNELILTINGKEVSVAWEDNASVTALRKLAADAPITIQMSMYGGFEQVGPIGTKLPRNDVQTTAGAGDIVLYSGNQIVVFYGSNSWSYTRLGHITDQDAEGMTALLGSGAVILTLSISSEMR